MMKLLDYTSFALSALTSFSSARGASFQAPLPPRKGTPSFYLAASPSSPAIDNPATIRLSANLTSDYPVVQFYFSITGQFSVYDPTTSTTYNAIVNSLPTGPGGSCNLGGALAFIPGGTTNNCAKRKGFYVNEENSFASQLGFGNGGGFYACGIAQSVYYEINASQPTGCAPITLYTIPVVQ